MSGIPPVGNEVTCVPVNPCHYSSIPCILCLDSHQAAAAAGAIGRGSQSSFWDVYEGTSKSDGSEVTALVLLKKHATYAEVNLARNAMNRMRALRHPNVLKVYDAVENDTGIYVVVERCSRLTDLPWRQEDRKQPCVWGLLDDSIVFATILSDLAFLDGFAGLYGFVFRFPPPRSLASVANPSVLDLYGLALVSAYLMNGEVLYKGEGSFNPGEDPAATIPAEFRGAFRSLSLHEVSRARDAGGVVTRLANSGYFKENPQVTILHFLDSQLRLATAAAQDEFFDGESDGGLGADESAAILPKTLPSLPVTMQVTVLLYSLVQVVDDVPRLAAPALVNLTKIGTYLSAEEFKRDLLPTVLKLFSSPDRTIRYRLLCNMEVYVDHMDNKVVENTLYPEISSGFNDSHSAIREQTLKSIVLLAPKLKTSTVTNKVLKNLTKLQGDPEPSIRTNTAICIGKISDYFDPAQKPQILLNAFVTGMKDSFPPCRIACIQALQATASIYNPAELGGKALPLLSLRLVDPSPEVEDAAFEALQPIVKTVRDGMMEARRIAKMKQEEQEDHGEASAVSHGVPGSTANSNGVQSVFGRFGMGMSKSGPTSGRIGDDSHGVYSKIDAMPEGSRPAYTRDDNIEVISTRRKPAPTESTTAVPAAAPKIDLDFDDNLDNVGDDFWGDFDDVPLPEENHTSSHYVPESTDLLGELNGAQETKPVVKKPVEAGTASGVKPTKQKETNRKISEGWGDDFDWDNF
ncbi:hypothetical protein FOL47_009263 [Perkinsus chesapeaki]|uniref:SCY1-like protein 2 n=1 Tax=Perkinsus chesapeaki TaxID=330153 RepID=A0A7J6L9K6_PERCH|nr:hypothetical protein FOL47_009263 [Perkinsus chesapeaki]